MRRVLAVALVVALAACGTTTRTTTTTTTTPSAGTSRGPSTAATLGIPPGHLPPPGRCRVWIPGEPPGHQPRARSCEGIRATAPAGSWIIYRPDADRRHVHVHYVDRQRAGVVIEVKVFEAETGKYVREGKP